MMVRLLYVVEKNGEGMRCFEALVLTAVCGELDEARERYDQFGMSAFDKGTTMDTDDLLNQMFSGGMGGMGGMPGMSGRAHGSGRSDRFQRKPRGKDVVQNYEISLEDLYKGRTVKLASTRNKLCTICTG
jgi:DnaJ family protein A protein 2